MTIFIPFLIKGKVAAAVHREADNMMYAKVEFTDLRIDLIKHFPLVSFNIKNIQITGTETEFRGDTLLLAKQLEIGLSPISLFKNDGYEIREIFINSPLIEAQVAPNGRVSWNIFKPDTTHQQKDTLHPSSYTAFHLRLNKLRIQNGQILFTDLESMHGLECKNLNLILKGDLSATTPSLHIASTFEEICLSKPSNPDQCKAQIEFNGSIHANFPEQRFSFGKNEYKIDGKSETLTGDITINEDNFTTSVQPEENHKEIYEIFHFVSALYLKKYETNYQSAHSKPATRNLVYEKYAEAEADSILMNAQNEADSILIKADNDIRMILERAENPILKIAAKKAAKKIYEKSRKEAKEVISEAENEASKLIPAE
ncbi:MAG: hypothetical protein ACRCX4_13380 [Bacteroidales bacterium]